MDPMDINEEINDGRYNALYPKPNEEISGYLRKYIDSNCKLNLGTHQDISMKRLFPRLIKKCIRAYFSRKCTGCGGSHKFAIAGGYASYLADITTNFNDIDIYIDCRRTLDQGTIHSTNYVVKCHGIVATVAYHGRPKIQFIQVNFDIGVEPERRDSDEFRSILAVYVINKFDLPLCRVAAFVPLTPQGGTAYIINATSFNIFKTPSSEARRLKYENRRNKQVLISPPSLQLTALFELIDKIA